MKILKIKKVYLLMLILTLAVGLAYVGRSFFEPKARPKPVEIKTPEILQKVREAPRAAEPVGTAMAPTVPAKYPNLRLEGTVIAKKPSAYIRDLDSQKAGYYNIGDTISNAKIIDIRRGEAALDAAGTKYTLYLEGAASDNPITQLSDNFMEVARDKLLAAVNAEEESLKAGLNMKPCVNKKGNFYGYKLDGIKTGSLPYFAGLRNGDIVKEVNEQKLLSQQKAIQTFKKVRRLKDVTVSLSRDEKDINLKYKVK